MNEQIESEVRPKNGGKLQKVPFLKIVFWPKKWSHMKVLTFKISYLGEINSILPGHMAEQLAIEVNVNKSKIELLMR